MIKHKFSFVVTLLLLSALFCGCARIPTGEVGVLRSFGKPQAILEDGTYLIAPYKKVVRLNIQTNVLELERIPVRTSDLQLVYLSVAVNYSIDEKKAIVFFDRFKDIKDCENRFINPCIIDALNDIAKDYSIEELQNRGSSNGRDQVDEIIVEAERLGGVQRLEIERLKNELKDSSDSQDKTSSGAIADEIVEDKPIEALGTTLKECLLESLKNRICSECEFILIRNLSILDVDFSSSYDEAIEKRSEIVARIQAQRYQFAGAIDTARREIAAAQGVANAARRTAENNAETIRQKGINEAETIIKSATSKAEGYRMLGESLSPEVIKAKKLEKWDGNVPNNLTITSGNESLLLNVAK